MLKRDAVAILALTIAATAWAGPAEDKALQDAALALNVEAVAAALKKGADPNSSTSTARKMTPLSFATMGSWRPRGDGAKSATAIKLYEGGFTNEEIDKYLAIEVTKLLFAAGARLGPYDRTVLFHPIASGNVELVRLLIDKGASVTADLEGYTPTELAKKYGQEAVYEMLISRGGVPADPESSAQLALVETASNSDIEGMARALKSGANINGFDVTRETALIAATRHGIYERRSAEAVWWLLDHGADPNVKGESKFRDLEGVPLHIFVAMNTKTLSGNSNRPDAQSLAEETLYRMLKAGAKVSGTDSIGRTPLHVAAKVDNVRAAAILIKEGAKVVPRDNTGKTPLDYAESAAMIKLLKQNGATEQ